VNTANRILAIAVGLILAGLGVCGILINTGHMPRADRDVTIWTDAMTRRMHDWGNAVTVVGIIGGLIVALVGFTLIRSELRWQGRTSVSELVFAGPGTGGEASAEPAAVVGKTRIAGSTLRRPLNSDLQNDPRIKDATVRLTGDVSHPRLDLQIEVRPGTELLAVQSYVTEALARFHETSQLEPIIGETVITVG
jgi:hypothetical protein